MKNKKGFTLIELLAVIAILGIVLTIAAISVFSVINDSEDKSDKIDSNLVLRATETYITENFDKIIDELESDYLYFLPISKLVKKNYIKIKNESKLNDNRCVQISYKNDNINVDMIVDTCPVLLSASDLIISSFGTEITDYKGSETNIAIPFKIGNLTANITKIGKEAFKSKGLKNVIIPNTVENIEYGAFENNQLTNVIIPNSVTSIGSYAFTHNQLTNVIIPDSVTSISINAFTDNLLTNIVIPNSITSISEGTFSQNKLTSVTISNSVTSIGNGAFRINELMNVTIPNSVTYIGEEAFESNKLKSVTIPNSVTVIGSNAFDKNPNLEEIIVEGKDSASDFTSLGTNWNGTCTNITYKP